MDGNISPPRRGQELGVKTELKNMNSFRFLERGIEAEIERQRKLLDAGEQVEQETFHLPRGEVADPAALEGVRARLPLLPRAGPRRRPDRGDGRGGAGGAARAAGSPPRALRLRGRPRRGSRGDARFRHRVRRVLRARARRRRQGLREGDRELGHRRARRGLRQAEEVPLESKATPESVAALAGLVEGKTISHGSGKQVLARLVAAGGDPAQIRRAGAGADL